MSQKKHLNYCLFVAKSRLIHKIILVSMCNLSKFGLIYCHVVQSEDIHEFLE
jgi:hypothetical protein